MTKMSHVGAILFSSRVYASTGQKFDVLIDGANIGYYKKSGYVDGDNFADHVQIDWVSLYTYLTINIYLLYNCYGVLVLP
jgi:hypothetical protein